MTTEMVIGGKHPRFDEPRDLETVQRLLTTKVVKTVMEAKGRITPTDIQKITGLSDEEVFNVLHGEAFRDLVHQACSAEVSFLMAQMLGGLGILLGNEDPQVCLAAGRLTVSAYKALADAATKHDAADGVEKATNLLKVFRETDHTARTLQRVADESSRRPHPSGAPPAADDE